jgi:hypothetical protein
MEPKSGHFGDPAQKLKSCSRLSENTILTTLAPLWATLFRSQNRLAKKGTNNNRKIMCVLFFTIWDSFWGPFGRGRGVQRTTFFEGVDTRDL